MDYINLTQRLEKHIEFEDESSYTDHSEKEFLEKHFISRGRHLLLTPLSAITCALDILVGSILFLKVLSNGGTKKNSYERAFKHLESSQYILSLPYMNFVKIFNPAAIFSEDIRRSGVDQVSYISNEGDGLISDYPLHYMRAVATECYRSDKALMRQGAARAIYAMRILVAVITRVADAIIGVAAAPLALFTFGYVNSLNNLAFRALQAPGIIGDLFYTAIKLVNPLANVKAEIEVVMKYKLLRLKSSPNFSVEI